MPIQEETQINLSEFSLIIRAVGINKQTGERYWKATTSDIFPDSYNDEMSLDLYRSFLSKIESGVLPPDQYRSESWPGGMPYVSVSHYREHSVAGDTDKVYVDGAVLKANGTFRDTPLGKACFDALCDDLYNPKRSQTGSRVRVSIAFLDYKHEHKSNGFVFSRSDSDSECPMCLEERKSGKMPGRIFLDGLLIHFAMTRVPVNRRTLMEVKSMTTRLEDAESIVGEQLAKELEEQERSLVSRSDLIIKSEDAPVEKSDGEDEEEQEYRPFGGATSMKDAKKYVEESKEQRRMGDIWFTFQSVLGNIARSMEIEDKASAISALAEEFKTMVSDKKAMIFESLASVDVLDDPEVINEEPEKHEIDSLEKVIERIAQFEESLTTALESMQNMLSTKSEATVVSAHPLDAVLEQLRSDFDSVSLMDGSGEEKLRSIQGTFGMVGEEIKRHLVSAPAPVVSESVSGSEMSLLVNALQKLSDKVDLLSSQQPVARSMVSPVVPSPRSISPAKVEQITTSRAPVPSGPTPVLRALINRSVGLE